VNDSDGIDEAIEQALRAALMGAARTGEQLSRLREASARRAEAASKQEAAEYGRRLQAQQAEARSVYSQVANPAWWDRAEHNDIVNAYETAHAWKDHDPQAEAAITTTREQVKQRYDVDLPNDPGAARAAMSDAEQFYNTADRQHDQSSADRAEEAALLIDADAEDRLAEQARHDGNPEAAQDHQNRAQDNNRAAGNAYDSAERRDADAAEWAKSGDAAAVQARRTADLSNARPATEATRPRRTPKNRTTSRRPTRTRSRNAGVSR